MHKHMLISYELKVTLNFRALYLVNLLKELCIYINIKRYYKGLCLELYWFSKKVFFFMKNL